MAFVYSDWLYFFAWYINDSMRMPIRIPLRGLDRLKGSQNFVWIWWRKINCVRLHSWREDNVFSFYSKWLLWKPATPFWGFNWKQWYQWRRQFLLLVKTSFDFRQAHRASFIFFLCSELNFWQLTLVFCAFYRLYPEITCFCNKPSGQIFLCHVTDVRYYNILLGQCITTLLVFDEFRNFS